MLMETADVRVLRLEVKGFFWGALFWCSVLNSSQNWKHRGYRERQRERESETVCMYRVGFFFFLHRTFKTPARFRKTLINMSGEMLHSCISVRMASHLFLVFLFKFPLFHEQVKVVSFMCFSYF